MPLDEADLKRLWDMLNAARKAVAFVSGWTYDQYREDEKTMLAIERLIEIIGEGARGVSPEARLQLAQINWNAIIATRHIIAHQYDEVDHATVWRILEKHIPPLVEQLEPVLAPYERDA